MLSQGNIPEGKTHPGSLECDSRQIIQAQTSDTDRMVPISAGVQSLVLQVGPTTSRPVCNPVQSQTSHVCFTGTRSTAWAVDALSLPWENLDVYAFTPVALLTKVVAKVMDQGCQRMILIAPGWPNMPWFWDLVNLSV